MAPKGWKIEKLSSLCEKISVGLAISVTPFMRKAGTKLIRNQNIKRNFFKADSVVYIDNEFAEKNKSKRVQQGDVVAVRTGSNIGEACIVPEAFDGALTFTTLIARPNELKLSSEFLCLHINSERGVSEVNRLMAGGGKPNLNSGELKNYSMLTPPMNEQCKIAKILCTWDNAINTNEQLISNSKQKKKALMQQLLRGEKRFSKFNDSWKLISIKDILNESRITSNENDPSKRITVRLNFKGIEKRKHRGTEAIDSTSYFVRNSGQFIYGKQNIHKGAFGIIPDELNGYETSQDLPCFDFLGVCCPRWFLYYISQESFYSSLEYKMTGTGSKRLSPTEFLKIKINIPSFKEQKKISSVLTCADKEIELLKQQLAELKKEKKALMQQLLTGKRRVKIEGKTA